MSVEQIGHDLARKLSAEVDAVLRRELRIAQMVLDGQQVVTLYLDLAAQIGSSAIGTAIGARKPEHVPAELYDRFASGLSDLIASHKEKTLAALERLERERAAA